MEKIPLTQTMFTAAPLPLNHPCSFSFTTTTTHHLTISKPFNLLTVSAKWVRKNKNSYKHNYDTEIEEEEEIVVQEEEGEEIGAVGHVLMKSLKSDIPPPTVDAIQKKSTPTSHDDDDDEEEEEEVEEEKEEERKIELSGMEVLMALQRAKSQTRSKPRRRRKQKGSKHMKGGRGKEDGDDDDAIMVDVKPLNVKSDWGTRLDECEKSLQELLLHQKF